MKIAVIQGPNLNMLGVREQHIYGAMTLEQVHNNLDTAAKQNGVELEFFQSNLEGEIVDRIQECLGTVDAIMINPAAYSHTSIAIKDALSAVNMPVVEVHISNIYRREEFRQKSITASSSAGIISGFGTFGYHLGLISLIQIVNEVKAINEARAKEENK
ncbi:3-dehydroquinate dehydratase [Aliarcobacter thereius]|uniref:3-dehydroquinate dehydratase n=2 Tax=Aliarcobacter thereius TaxID=544718 RepID=A0A1C0B919_9BACT|nr:type II 3-dehydroquinate dehydratase [Aliarcobacter thereius]OCL88758.1 3-dehydroquinate dehydratase [Aliarcobacter thereius]OCL92253.1 3-dehydroquinate dehydratase [Aliarcobacter thereius]OCL94651.1 3-dehydroquinate dehydratase [Aliarcobacter thereius LMG 24486]OCM00097.1 3-dehydroquinate dehydratase [Aliarcobacter thereius]QBF15473.1 3-dehydroquinate dehydratase [Aliarcobacter thereius LMG 24486]